jgi:uncharacterized membrane protein (UPF0127 family)
MKRHVGKMSNTDQRLVIVFMQIPGREDHALVIPTDTLPARYEQAVMEVLESPEGQAEETLANTLDRRLMPNNGKSILRSLHEDGYLKPVPIANILMLPMPNMPFPLVTILEGMGKTVPAQAVQPDMSSAVEKYNQIAVNQKIEGIENRRAVAQNLLIEAEMLEGEARKKRDRAYTVAPEMAPKTIPTFTAAATAPVRQEVALAAQTSGKTKRVIKAKKAAI